jgi:hypothetical protein
MNCLISTVLQAANQSLSHDETMTRELDTLHKLGFRLTTGLTESGLGKHCPEFLRCVFGK